MRYGDVKINIIDTPGHADNVFSPITVGPEVNVARCNQLEK